MKLPTEPKEDSKIMEENKDLVPEERQEEVKEKEDTALIEEIAAKLKDLFPKRFFRREEIKTNEEFPEVKSPFEFKMQIKELNQKNILKILIHLDEFKKSALKKIQSKPCKPVTLERKCPLCLSSRIYDPYFCWSCYNVACEKCLYSNPFPLFDSQIYYCPFCKNYLRAGRICNSSFIMEDAIDEITMSNLYYSNEMNMLLLPWEIIGKISLKDYKVIKAEEYFKTFKNEINEKEVKGRFWKNNIDNRIEEIKQMLRKLEDERIQRKEEIKVCFMLLKNKLWEKYLNIKSELEEELDQLNQIRNSISGSLSKLDQELKYSTPLELILKQRIIYEIYDDLNNKFNEFKPKLKEDSIRKSIEKFETYPKNFLERKIINLNFNKHYLFCYERNEISLGGGNQYVYFLRKEKEEVKEKREMQQERNIEFIKEGHKIKINISMDMNNIILIIKANNKYPGNYSGEFEVLVSDISNGIKKEINKDTPDRISEFKDPINASYLGVIVLFDSDSLKKMKENKKIFKLSLKVKIKFVSKTKYSKSLRKEEMISFISKS